MKNLEVWEILRYDWWLEMINENYLFLVELYNKDLEKNILEKRCE